MKTTYATACLPALLPTGLLLGLLLLAGCEKGRETLPGNETIRMSTLAGSGEWGYADGDGNTARFAYPRSIAIDARANLYVADEANNRIRKVSPTGEVSTVAGSGLRGHVDGPGAQARFNSPWGIAVDAAGNLYVADRDNHCIRKVSPTGEVSTLAGGVAGFADGRGAKAQFNEPFGIRVDATGTLFVADFHNRRIRQVSPEGEVSTLAQVPSLKAGSFADAAGGQARFNASVAIDAAGNLYVADTFNSRIRKIVMQ